MLSLALEKMREFGFKEVFCNSSAGNIASQKVIEASGGIFIEEENGSRQYRFEL